MKRHKKAMGRKELVSIYNSFVENTIRFNILTNTVLFNNCDKVQATIIGNITNLLFDPLRNYVTNNLNYGEYNNFLFSFIDMCLKRDGIEKAHILNVLDIESSIEYIKDFATDQRYSKEFDILFDTYFSIRRRPLAKSKIQLLENQTLSQCMIFREMYCVTKELEYISMGFESERNISKNLKPLASSSNSNRTRHLPHLNQIGNSSNEVSSHALILLVIGVFFVLFALICKFESKFCRRNGNISEALSVNRLRNGRTWKNNIKDQSLYSKLKYFLKSCEQNCKRGH